LVKFITVENIQNHDEDSLDDFDLSKPNYHLGLPQQSSTTIKWFDGRVGTDNIKNILRGVRAEDVMTKAVQRDEIKWNSVGKYCF